MGIRLIPTFAILCLAGFSCFTQVNPDGAAPSSSVIPKVSFDIQQSGCQELLTADTEVVLLTFSVATNHDLSFESYPITFSHTLGRGSAEGTLRIRSNGRDVGIPLPFSVQGNGETVLSNYAGDIGVAHQSGVRQSVTTFELVLDLTSVEVGKKGERLLSVAMDPLTWDIRDDDNDATSNAVRTEQITVRNPLEATCVF